LVGPHEQDERPDDPAARADALAQALGARERRRLMGHG
jgi:hypothetical protein